MKSLPIISVVIPSYNKVKFISDTLESIVSQNYPHYEIIIQDGGSTDGSLDIIKKYARKYPNNISWISKKDKGQLDAINKGLKKAKGDVVTFINADDVYKDGAFQVVGELYRKEPNLLWIVGKGDIINSEGNITNRPVTEYKNLLLKINSYKLLLSVNYISQPSVFINRKTYNKYGPFTGTKNYVMEYDFWLKLGKVAMPIVIDSYLASFRLFSGNISTTSFSELLNIDYSIATKYTSNPLLLTLHRLNNYGRIILAKIINFGNKNTEE